MLSRRLPLLLSVLVLSAGPGTEPPHTWIADLKANRAGFAAVGVLLEGEVVELRRTSKGSVRGGYPLAAGGRPGPGAGRSGYCSRGRWSGSAAPRRGRCAGYTGWSTRATGGECW